jgi:predicted nucleotidyltransferase
MVTQEQIQEITNIIVQTVHPKKVFLIGSYAKGTSDKKSDLDFLIISSNPDIPKYERTTEIQKRLFHYPQIPIDLIMFTENEINKKIDNPLTFISDAIKNGIVVYES